MNILLLIVGIVVGAVLAHGLLRSQASTDRETLKAELAEIYQAKAGADQARIVQSYEARIHTLETRHAETILLTRRDSANQSRAVLKGKMAEQIAPLLPGFDYWPADARFLGDPIDYVVFNGYSAVKDGNSNGDELEIVILDIKRGARTTLNHEQSQIARAIEAGRVRFEVVRVFDDGTVRSHSWEPPRKTNNV